MIGVGIPAEDSSGQNLNNLSDGGDAHLVGNKRTMAQRQSKT